jgi:Domain of unknown function (DUF397)
MHVHYPLPTHEHKARGERGVSMQAYNGMPSAHLAGVAWQKSRRSNPSGNCVEVAVLPARGGVAIRNSRDPDGPALVYTRDEIAAFLGGVLDGDFDDLMA